MGDKNEEFVVTPWEVRGIVDYDRLVKEFGTQFIDDRLLDRVKRIIGEIHPLLKRRIFFSHRDFDWILDKFEQGENFALYTGRGPSGPVHLGHMVPWIFTKYLQDKFDAELYFQVTDDEKFLHDPHVSLEITKNYAMENIIDLLALGFKEGKTFIFIDTDYAKTLYNIAIKVAKHITFSTVKAVFGFDSSINVGMSFFPTIQAVPCFLPSVLKGKNTPVLIPAAIDQDPYWRGIARFVAPKLGFYKPAQIHSKFFPGLGKGGKMSASEPNTAIFTTDDEELVDKKIMNAFTGGRATVEEHRKLGGQPDICPVYHYYEYLFEEDDKKLKEIYNSCKLGTLICGDCKAILANKVKKFMKEHQRKREKAKDIVNEFILKD
ncbi:MAG: tryptophan--tRNA ligase [Nitrososphaerales archaeon]